MNRKIVFKIVFILLVVFFAWRFLRPMNIFVVNDRFAWPVATTQTPAVLGNLKVKECAVCHQDFYAEWKTAMHSQAWVEPYFQTDWKFDRRQHSCRLCHTPLDRQQPHIVLGYRDTDKWDPVLENNPEFSPELQHEGVTCAACHYRNGKIVGVLGDTDAPHPVQKIDDPNQICVRCHIVDGERWDTFFRFPPCGTVAEIKKSEPLIPLINNSVLLNTLVPLKEDADIATQMQKIKTVTIKGRTGENIAGSIASLGCVQCHMPVVKRALVSGGKVRQTRHHYWRGGHDPDMVKKALSVKFIEIKADKKDQRRFELTIANTGAAHYVPTGTPDRYLSIELRSLDKDNNILKERIDTIKRTVMWRPFIVDLWDTRLPRWQPQKYMINVPKQNQIASVEAVVRYHLLDEKRRKRINYKNKTPIEYELFKQKIVLGIN